MRHKHTYFIHARMEFSDYFCNEHLKLKNMPWLYPPQRPDVERELIKEKLRSFILLLAKVKKRSPIEIIREMKNDLDQRKLEKIERQFGNDRDIYLS